MALLSAFAEMGLKFRLDMPEQAMEVTTVFFRSTTPANEYHVRMPLALDICFGFFSFKTFNFSLIILYFSVTKKTMKSLADQRTKNMKAIQEKMNLDQKEMKRFNPVSSAINLHFPHLPNYATDYILDTVIISKIIFRLTHFLVILLYLEGFLIF